MLYLNMYKDNIYAALLVPIYAYRVRVNTEVSELCLDVLGQTLLKLIKEVGHINPQKLSAALGIPLKYQKLVENEIAELLDLGFIENENGSIKVSEESAAEASVESLYILFDRTNKRFIPALLKEDFFNRLVKTYSPCDQNRCIALKTPGTEFDTDYYTINKEILNIIDLNNRYIDFHLEGSGQGLQEELDEFSTDSLTTSYKLQLNTVDNIEKPEVLNLVIKVIQHMDGSIGYQWPFTMDTSSVYMDKYIKDRIDFDKFKTVLLIEEFESFERQEQDIEEDIPKLRLIEKNKDIKESLQKVLYYNRLLKLENNLYKKLQTPILEYDKIVKRILQQYVYSFEECKLEIKNICIDDYIDKDVKEGLRRYELFEHLLYKKVKKIIAGRKINSFIMETSIANYVQMIYLGKFFAKGSTEDKMYKLFIEDHYIVAFLNDLWKYRNSTTHNVEKGQFYEEAYDLELKEKERLLEVYEDIKKGLFHLLEKLEEL